MLLKNKSSVHTVQLNLLFLILSSVLVCDVIANVENSTLTRIYDNDTDFTFLVASGYRPKWHTLSKYVVSIRKKQYTKYFGDDHFCSGAIISSKIVLTAAHCIMKERQGKRIPVNPNEILVVAGTPNRTQQTYRTQLRKVEGVYPHVAYDKVSHVNDIGLIYLLDEIRQDNEFAQQISLASKPYSPNSSCTLLGWGRLFYNGPIPDGIIYVDLEIQRAGLCRRSFKNYTDGMLCAIDNTDQMKGACKGDSGGPLICDNEIFGLVSFGGRCSFSNDPSYFADVYYYRHWIWENMRKAFLQVALENRNIHSVNSATRLIANVYVQLTLFIFTFMSV